MASSLAFEPLTNFDPQVEADFARVGDVEFYRAEHDTGRCALFAVLEKGKRVGSIMFCSETKESSGEKIFGVMAASTKTNRSLIRDGKELITEYARRTGHHTLKFYTSEPRLAAEFLKNGARAKVTWSV